MAGFIQTVLGKINPEICGITLTHEHFSLDYTNFYVSPPSELKEFLDGEITLQNVGLVQRYPYSNKSNISFFTDDLKDAVFNDLKIFKKFGGGTLVENTSHGLKRDVRFLREAAQKTGVHVVAGTGYYLASVQPNFVLEKTIEQLYDIMHTDLVLGCLEMPDIKCGVIGEVASDYPIHPFEIKSIKATGLLQEQLKCPVTFHPGRDPKAPSDIMRIYTESGGDASKAVMSHLDRTLRTNEELLEFASEYKCFLQHDLFGTEVLTYQFDRKFQMPTDFQRIQRVQTLIENGYLDRVLLSHDIHTKHRLAHFGGHGYFHLLANIIPKMREVGVSKDKIDQITVNNPKNWLRWTYN